MGNQSMKKNILSLTFLTFFLTVSVLSSVFILTHANHEHDHRGMSGGCTICVQLQSAENMIKQLGTALTGTACFTMIGFFIIISLSKTIFVYIPFSTPVTSKVQMNN